MFRYPTGTVTPIEPGEIAPTKRLILPPLPSVNKPRVEHLKAQNKTQIHDQPWTLGLLEAVAAVEIIARKRLETKNRIALILLDSNFEIALKESSLIVLLKTRPPRRRVGVMALGPSAMAEIDCIVQPASSTRASCTSGTVGMLNSRTKARRSIGRYWRPCATS